MNNYQIKISLILLCIILIILISSLFLNKYNDINLNNIFLPVFSKDYYLGTDQFGRDILSRICRGTLTSVIVGLLASTIASIIGISIGLVAGFYKKIDSIIMRFVDIVQSFPTLLILIALISIFKPSIQLTIIVIGIVSWTGIARIVRGQVLTIKSKEYVQSAISLGYSQYRILFYHILINCLSPIIIVFTLGVSNAIMFEAGLSFLGLGIQPPNPSLGRMINEGKDFIMIEPNLIIVPSIILSIIVISFNLLGEGLREILDVKN